MDVTQRQGVEKSDACMFKEKDASTIDFMILSVAPRHTSILFHFDETHATKSLRANPQQRSFSAKHVEIVLWPHHRICQDVHHPAAECSTNNCSQPELLKESAIETCKGISFCHSA